MRPLLATLLLAPIAFPLPLPVAAACSAGWTTAAEGGLYVRAGTGPGYTDVDVMGVGVEDRIVRWRNGADVHVWRETNGVVGLQTQDSDCGRADERVTHLYMGFGQANVTV